MAAHFLHTAIARSLRDEDMAYVFNGEEAEPLAYMLFMYYRWGSLTEQICPKCGVIAAHYPRPAHRQWRCRACKHDFSVKSGSLWQHMHLPYRKLLKALFLFANEPKGLSAIRMSQKLGCTYEAAYVLLHKVRSAIWTHHLTSQELRSGEFELDVVWVQKAVRKHNIRTDAAYAKRNEVKRAERIAELVRDRMSLEDATAKAWKEIPTFSRREKPNPNKHPVLAIVQRDLRPPPPVGGKGARRKRHMGILWAIAIPLESKSESYESIAPLVQSYVAPGSIDYSDDADAYKGLNTLYDHRSIKHEEMYSAGDGLHTNFVESSFSRWRRMECGTHHRMSTWSIPLYFADCSWRETVRHQHPADRLHAMLQMTSRMPVSDKLVRYGQSKAAWLRRKLRDYAPTQHVRGPIPRPNLAGHRLDSFLVANEPLRVAMAELEVAQAKAQSALRKRAGRAQLSWHILERQERVSVTARRQAHEAAETAARREWAKLLSLMREPLSPVVPAVRTG